MDEDWIKARSWDLPEVQTFDDLLGYLGVANADEPTQRAALDHWLALPAALAMPTQMAEDVRRFMTGQDQGEIRAAATGS